jgi:hypothetical protein
MLALRGVSCQAAARRLDVDYSTIWRWRTPVLARPMLGFDGARKCPCHRRHNRRGRAYGTGSYAFDRPLASGSKQQASVANHEKTAGSRLSEQLFT